MFDRPPQQPQSVGDIIGRAFRLFRQNVPLLLRAQLMPCIIITVGHILVQGSISFGFRSGKAPLPIVAAIAAIAVGIIISLVGIWLLTIRQFAFVRLVNGLSANFAEALKQANKKKWTVIALFVVSYFFVVGAILFWGIELSVSGVAASHFPALAIGGLLFGLLGMCVSLLILSNYYLLTTAALACEDQKASDLILCCFRLIFNDFGRACGFGILLMLLVTIFSWTLSLPIVALTVFELFRNGITPEQMKQITPLPLYCLVLNQIWQSLINMLLVPITFMAAGLFYRDLKVRQEGLDVMQSLTLLAKTDA